MPTLEHGGPWAVWDVKGLRPDRGRERAPARPSTASLAWQPKFASERWGPTGEEASGRGRPAPRCDERRGVLRLLQAGALTAEEAARLLGILDRSEAGAGEATGAAGGSASPPRP